jgi:branched-chain amino acid transport system substrate-binding protein
MRGGIMAARRHTRAVPLVASALALALAAAGCGSSGKSAEPSKKVEQSATSTTSAGGTATSAGVTTTTTAGPDPQTWDEWEANAAANRATVVQRIKDNHWGTSADGKTVTGPEGFKIDLTKCAAGWSNTEGLTDDSIKIGHTLAYSGTLAEYGNIGRGMNNYFQYVNTKYGGIKDSVGKSRKINFVEKDDGYDPARTIPLVDELMDSEKVFALTTGGSANVMRVYDKTNARCVPQPIALTGHPAWGDPVNHPWTTGLQLAYSTEAILWGSYIEKFMDLNKLTSAKVAGLVINNDFGRSYSASFKTYLAQAKHDIKFEYETIEPTAPNITNEMTTLAAKKPDVFIAMTAGTSCTQAVTEAAQDGMQKAAKILFQPSVCKGINFVGKDKVGGDGSASEGWMVFGGGVIDFNDPGKADLPQIKFAKQQLATQGYDAKTSSQFGNGYFFGWPLVEYLRIGAALDGGLTRANFMLAIHTIEMRHPFVLKGITLSMNGNKGAYFVEGSELGKFSAPKQTWEQIGDVIDLKGKSSNCAWNQSTSTCA